MRLAMQMGESLSGVPPHPSRGCYHGMGNSYAGVPMDGGLAVVLIGEPERVGEGFANASTMPACRHLALLNAERHSSRFACSRCHGSISGSTKSATTA